MALYQPGLYIAAHGWYKAPAGINLDRRLVGYLRYDVKRPGLLDLGVNNTTNSRLLLDPALNSSTSTVS